MSKVLPISCLGSCYLKSSAHDLICSINSLFLSSHSPAQIVLVIDGPISDNLADSISYLENLYPALDIIRLETNVGLGSALHFGLQQCSYDFVFRFDTDDINLSGRLSVQYQFLIANPDVSCCGSDVFECRRDAANLYFRLKTMPRRFYFLSSLLRNPLNHPTVAFRRLHVEMAGGYCDCKYFEDYSLWLRLLFCGFKIHNLSSPPLVCMDRPSFSSRRSGLSYLMAEFSFSVSLFRLGFSAFPFMFLIFLRAFLRFILFGLLFSTPWRSSWILMDDGQLVNFSSVDIEAIKARFRL